MKTPNKLPAEIVKLLLPRLADEFTAFYTYRAAANWCKDKGFFEAAKYFAKESEDELSHAKKIEQYLVDWNVLPDLPTIEEPIVDFKDLPNILDVAYGLEYSLYEDYEETSKKVWDAGDICTFDFLKFFRETQTASVAEFSDKLNMLEGVEANKLNLLLLEKKLF